MRENNLNMDGYMQYVNIYNDLTKENPSLIPRETLEDYTRQIIAGQNLLVSNFYIILGNIIKSRFPSISSRSMVLLNELGSILQIPIPTNIQNINAPNMVLDFDIIQVDKQLILLQNANQDTISFLRNARVKSRAIILLNFEKEKLTSLLSSEGQDEMKSRIEDFADQLRYSSDYAFASRLPILEFEKIPLEKQIMNILIEKIVEWVNKEVKDISKLTPTKTIDVVMKDGKPNEGQMSPNMAFVTSVKPDKENTVILKFKTSGKQCSPYRLHILIDDVEKTVTDWFGYTPNGPPSPMETQVVVLENVSHGSHELKLQPEGRQEGCNQGYIMAWEGTLYLY